MSDDNYWAPVARDERSYYRMHNNIGRVTLPRGDDSGGVQTHQIQGYTTGRTQELRNDMQRYGSFGFSSMPLPGAKGVAVYQSGNRGFATVVADEDPRYRPKGLKPGETHLYLVDKAKQDGTGGTTRSIIKGLLGWLVSIYGATIAIGTQGDTTTITIDANKTITVTGGSAVTVKAPNVKLDGNVEITGTLKVDGATTVADISIGGTESGGGPI